MTSRVATPRLRTAESIPPAPRQARSVEKRTRLLRAAGRLFAERGYEATTIEAITSAAGTASGAFYTYFRSKRQLLVLLMDDLLDGLARIDLRPRADGDVRNGLRRFLREVLRTDRQYYGVIRAWQEAALSDGALGEMQIAIESWTHARILGVFRRLQTLPNARRDRDLPRFARMMDRHFWALLARGASLSTTAFAHEVTLAADVIDHYLFHDASGAPQ